MKNNILYRQIVFILFSPPFFMDYVVTITSFFFLQNLYVRFRTLNDVWKCLPTGLNTVSSQWTHKEIVGVIENTRSYSLRTLRIAKSI